MSGFGHWHRYWKPSSLNELKGSQKCKSAPPEHAGLAQQEGGADGRAANMLGLTRCFSKMVLERTACQSSTRELYMYCSSKGLALGDGEDGARRQGPHPTGLF